VSGRVRIYHADQRPRRLARPRTPPFHGDNTGSNPVGDANQNQKFRSIASEITLRGNALLTTEPI
jgi:hypothetical protein